MAFVKQAGIDAPRTGGGTVPGTVPGVISGGALAGVSGGVFSAILRPTCTAMAGPFWQVICGWGSCGGCQSDFPAGSHRDSQADLRRDSQSNLRGDFRGDFDGVLQVTWQQRKRFGHEITKARSGDGHPKSYRGCNERARSRLHGFGFLFRLQARPLLGVGAILRVVGVICGYSPYLLRGAVP
jgi:hypothetical protein